MGSDHGPEFNALQCNLVNFRFQKAWLYFFASDQHVERPQSAHGHDLQFPGSLLTQLLAQYTDAELNDHNIDDTQQDSNDSLEFER